MEDFLGECDLPHWDAVMHSYEKSGRVYSGNRKKKLKLKMIKYTYR